MCQNFNGRICIYFGTASRWLGPTVVHQTFWQRLGQLHQISGLFVHDKPTVERVWRIVSSQEPLDEPENYCLFFKKKLLTIKRTLRPVVVGINILHNCQPGVASPVVSAHSQQSPDVFLDKNYLLSDHFERSEFHRFPVPQTLPSQPLTVYQQFPDSRVSFAGCASTPCRLDNRGQQVFRRLESVFDFKHCVWMFYHDFSPATNIQ